MINHRLSITALKNLKKNFFFSYFKCKLDDKPSVIHNRVEKFEKISFFFFSSLKVNVDGKLMGYP